MQSIREAGGLQGKRVLARVGLNVPIHNSKIVNDFRIRKVAPLIRFLQQQGARTILLAHISEEAGGTLEPVASVLAKQCGATFVKDFLGTEGQRAVTNMDEGDVLLFENLRSVPGEAANDPDFVKQLAHYGDYYVKEAFSVSHREHASIVGLPKHLPHYSGIQFEREMRHLALAFNPPRPSLVIIGGIKFDTKLPLAKKFLDIADYVFVGGALANDFFNAQGHNMGDSVTSGKDFGLSEILDHERLILPRDVGGAGFVKRPSEVTDGEAILDAGPETIDELKTVIEASSFVLWNGPIGDYAKGFSKRNEELARIIANSTAQSIVGGGDTVASIAGLGLEDRFTFVSTAGGAMIQFLSEGTLPGIVALEGLA